MNNCNLSVARQYYAWVVKKDISNISRILHEEIEFIGPMSSLRGKAAVFAAIAGYANLVQDIDIIDEYAKNDKVLLTYLLLFQNKRSRAAVQLTFEDHKIRKLELYYDPTPFLSLRNDIFNSTAQ